MPWEQRGLVPTVEARLNAALAAAPPNADDWDVLSLQEGIQFWQKVRDSFWDGLWICVWAEFALGHKPWERQARKLGYAYAQALYDSGFINVAKLGEPPRRRWLWDSNRLPADSPRRLNPKLWIEDRDLRWDRRNIANDAGLAPQVESYNDGSFDWDLWLGDDLAAAMLARYRLALWVTTYAEVKRGPVAVMVLHRIINVHKRLRTARA